MNVRLNCDKCGGNVWTEKMPDSNSMLDLVCIICGKRSFVKEKEFEKALDNALKEKLSRQGRIVSAG